MNWRQAASACSTVSACERSGPKPFYFIISAIAAGLQTRAVFSAPIVIAVGFSPPAAGRHIIVAIFADDIAS
jgi:hypothetical protein